MSLRPVRPLVLAFAVLSVGFAVFVLAFKPIGVSEDEWWHLKTGKWIWEHDLVPPAHDIFAYPSLSYRWDNHEWLAQVLMYLAYRAGDATGFGPIRAVIAAKTLILLATFALVGWFCWLRSRRLALACLATFAAAVIACHSFHPRPPVITYFMIALFHFILAAYRAGRIRAGQLFVLPGIMLAWANLHGGFVLGGVLIAAFFAGEAAEALWFWWKGIRARATTPLGPPASLPAIPPNRERAQASSRRALVLLGIGILTGLFSLCTPFGWRLYLLSHRVMSEKSLVSMIWELWPSYRQTPYPPYVYYALSAFILIFGAVFRRRVFLGEALWIVFLFQQSFMHMRHLPLFAVAAAPLAAELAGAIWDWIANQVRPVEIESSPTGKPAPRGGAAAEILAGLATAGAALFYITWHFSIPAGEGRFSSAWNRASELLHGRAYWIDSYPVNLCDFIEDADFHGRMFNDSRYAGYIIWRFSPEKHLVFTDMRYDIFGADFFYEDLAVRLGRIEYPDKETGERRRLNWREVFDKYDINFAIIDKLEGRIEGGKESADWLIRLLEEAPDWTMVYNSAAGPGGLAIYLKVTPENAELLQRCRRLAPNGFYRRPDREEYGR